MLTLLRVSYVVNRLTRNFPLVNFDVLSMVFGAARAIFFAVLRVGSMKLTRFRGAPMLSSEGAHDAKKQTAVPAGILRADCRTGQDGPHAQRAVARVRL